MLLFCWVSFHDAAIPILGQLQIVDRVITKFAKMPSQACLRNRRSFASNSCCLQGRARDPHSGHRRPSFSNISLHIFSHHECTLFYSRCTSTSADVLLVQPGENVRRCVARCLREGDACALVVADRRRHPIRDALTPATCKGEEVGSVCHQRTRTSLHLPRGCVDGHVVNSGFSMRAVGLPLAASISLFQQPDP